jgi:membrane protease YdiL (CAAX protease family)
MEEIIAFTGLHRALTALALTLAGFLAYYRLAFSTWLGNRHKEITYRNNQEVSLFITRKSLGFLFLGLVPATLYFMVYGYPGYSTSMIIIPSAARWLIFTGICLLIVMLASILARNPHFYGRIPEMRIDDWNLARMGVLVGGWAVYLLAYEYLFRELLLFTWVEAIGIIPSIILNTLLYALVHLPKGMQETKGSLVFGPLLCMGSIITGSFLTAFVWHLVLAVSSELYSIHYNPAMRINFNGKIWKPS